MGYRCAAIFCGVWALLCGCHDESSERKGLIDASSPTDVGDVRPELQDDLGSDAGWISIEGTLEPTPKQEDVPADGAPDTTISLRETESLLGRIAQDETGFRGLWSHCRKGDFRLYNDRIEACIQGLDTNRYELFRGGSLVDLQPVGFAGEDLFDIHRPRIGVNTMTVDRVEVVRDGSDGRGAVLRTEGTDFPVAHFVGVVGASVLQSKGLKVVVEYRLFPGRNWIEVVTWIEAGSAAPPAVVGDWVGFGDRTKRWRPSTGFEMESSVEFSWLAAVGEGVSYAWAHPDGSVLSEPVPLGGTFPWTILRIDSHAFADGPHVSKRYLVVGDGSLESLRGSLMQLEGAGEERHTLRLEVVDHEGKPVGAGRSIEVLRDGVPQTWGQTGEIGLADFELAAGEYEIRVEGDLGQPGVTETISFVEMDSLTMTLPAHGTIRLDVTEAGSNRVLTVAASIRGVSHQWEGYAVGGSLHLLVAPGTYEVSVHHGPEYDQIQFEVEVTAGVEVNHSLELKRSVDTGGWIGADFHQHMEPSVDSEVNVQDRILENVAMGVEFVAPTDHDVVTDLSPFIAALGFSEEIASFPGVEVSPVIGHIGLYPMPYIFEKRGAGAIPLAIRNEAGAVEQRSIPDVIALARERSEDVLVQINHPRDGTGYFDTVGFEPDRDYKEITHLQWTSEMNTVEVVNPFSKTCAQMEDWFGLLNMGLTVSGLGNSDTHGLSNRAGLPRNYLAIDKVPGDLLAEDIVEALRRQRVTVGAHAFIDFADGRFPGDMVSASPNSPISFHPRVQTPNWSHVNRLALFVNGRLATEREWEAVGDGFDFDQTIEASFERDSWVVFVAWGPVPAIGWGHGKPALAFTNPIYIDTDGDIDGNGDVWEEPGPGIIEVDRLGLNWCD